MLVFCSLLFGRVSDPKQHPRAPLQPLRTAGGTGSCPVEPSHPVLVLVEPCCRAALPLGVSSLGQQRGLCTLLAWLALLSPSGLCSTSTTESQGALCPTVLMATPLGPGLLFPHVRSLQWVAAGLCVPGPASRSRALPGLPCTYPAQTGSPFLQEPCVLVVGREGVLVRSQGLRH